MRSLLSTFALTVILAALTAPTTLAAQEWAADPAADSAQAMQVGVPAGVYLFVPEESDEIEDAIDAAVDQMSWLIRGFARRRLRGANQPIDGVLIEYPGDTVKITLRQDDGPIPSPRSGEFVPYERPDGEVVRVKTELEPGVITQFFDSDDGQKEIVYRLRSDGKLELTATIFSDKLEQPLSYTWVYRGRR